MNRASVTLGLAVLFVAACDPAQVPPTPTPAPASSSPVATGPVEPPMTLGPDLPSPTIPDDTSPVILDPSLLDILPESIDGFPITEAPDEAALVITDPTLSELATALNAGVAVDTGAGDLAYALVVQLRPEALTDERFRQWRDSFDEGACTAAGGVEGHGAGEIGGRQTFITTCVAGMHTYHVWLREPNLLVSASSIGEARFGEKLIEGLRVPA